MVLLVVGAQGAVRLIADHDDGGLLGWVPGGFWVRAACYALAVVAGVGLAARGAKARATDDR
ncbi:hypothetical protein [Cryptosporangium arvum]|nr:hypothetical protein [Cryptosporangium arvum]